VQTPETQVSVWVHWLPSSQAVPSATWALEQSPVDGSQLPAVWHPSGASQSTGLPPVQTPAWQVSVCVHGLPSLQAVPSGTAAFAQTPVVASQVPTEWHWSGATQLHAVQEDAPAGDHVPGAHGVHVKPLPYVPAGQPHTVLVVAVHAFSSRPGRHVVQAEHSVLRVAVHAERT
jgi:hypothetical protein